MEVEMDDEGFIVGIHNYCNRWCERCPFTANCRVYEGISDEEGNIRPLDSQEEFMQEVQNNLGKAMEMLHQMAADQGIDLDALRSEENLAEADREELRLEKAVNASEACQAASTYIQLLKNWLDDNQSFFAKKSTEFQKQVDLDLSMSDPIDKALRVRDALEIMRFYHVQMMVKLRRATNGLSDDFWDKDDIQTDFNGSAKVALQGAEESLGAFEMLRTMFPEKTDDWIPIMAQLQRIIRLIEQEFPNARKFQRPGFDVMPEA